MLTRSLNRWSLIASVLLLAGCGAPMTSPSAQTAQAKHGPLVETLKRKPPQYDKVFPLPYQPGAKPVKVIAHRGYAKVAPENTLAAIRAAMDAGADAVEIDIHLTADNQLVVIHDWHLDRTTDGEGEVEEMTLEELKKLDAGSWFSPDFEGEPIPTLDEALVAMKGRVTPVIEIKTRSARVAKPLFETLQRHDMINRAFVTSFFGGPISTMRKDAPQVPLAVLVPPFISFTGRALDMRASTTQGYYKSIGKKNIDLAHSVGLEIHAWTVNDEASMRGLVSMGIDGIITDEVALAREVVDSHFTPEPQPAPVETPVPVEPGDEPAPPVAQGRRF